MKVDRFASLLNAMATNQESRNLNAMQAEFALKLIHRLSHRDCKTMDTLRTVITTAESSTATSRQAFALLGWLVVCFAPTLAVVWVAPDDWFAALNKPEWNPPSWLFGPVWTILYAMMAVSAWLVWREGGWLKQGWPLALFLMQLALNAIWTPLFFGMHSPALAFVDIVLLWLLIAATLWSFWPVSRLASLLLIPYLVWVSFAAVLNFIIWRMNL